MVYKKLIFNIQTILLLTCFVACSSKKKEPEKKPDPPTIVDVIIATPQNISNIIEANGTVIASESVELHPEISGRLTYLNVPEGAHVSKGTVLARVNDADLQAQLDKSKAQLALYQKTQERLQKLLDINGINQADYDIAENQVSSTRADIAYTQALISKTIIRAPFAGVVGLRQVSPGAYVSPATVIATLQQTNELKVDFTLPEEYNSIIKRGDTVRVELDAAKKLERKAVIVATEPQVNQNTRNILMRGVLQQGKGNPGAFVKVYVDVSTDAKSLMVPGNAIIPNDINKQLIIVKDHKAVFTNVETGMRDSDNVEITKGISAGDTIVVTGVLFARDKKPVNIRNVKKLGEINKEEE